MAHEGTIVRYLIASAVFYSKYLSDTRYRLDEDSLTFEPDFIVVGGGTAGLVVTTRLIEVGFNVLLLERGGSGNHYTDIPLLSELISREDEFAEDFFVREKKACLSMKEGCQVVVGKSLGGGSTHNGMIFFRGSPVGYDDWQEMGADGWSYKDNLPYFMKLENARNISGANPRVRGMDGPVFCSRYPMVPKMSQALISGLKEMGYHEGDLNEDPTLIGVTQASIGNGTRSSSLNAYLNRVVGSPRLKVFTQSLVTKIIFETGSHSPRAVGVEFVNGEKRFLARSKYEVIVSAGILGSPKLLMLSGIGPRSHLEKVGIGVTLDLPGVGRNMQDHVLVPLKYKIQTAFQHKLSMRDVGEYNERRTGIFAQYDAAFVGTFKGKQSIRPFDTRFQITVISINSQAEDSLFYEDEVKVDMNYLLLALVAVHSRGRVKLNATNPYGPVDILINMLSDQRDIEGAVEMIRFAQRYMKTDSVQKRLHAQLQDDPSHLCQQYKGKNASDTEYLKCIVHNYSMSAVHYAGTCKMGSRADPTAVVDNTTRVIGVEGLRVIDASIMPTPPRGNMNVGTTMVAEKASDMIITEYASKKTVSK